MILMLLTSFVVLGWIIELFRCNDLLLLLVPVDWDLFSVVFVVDLRDILEQMLFSVMMFGWCGYIQIYYRPELALLVLTSLIDASEHMVRNSCIVCFAFSL